MINEPELVIAKEKTARGIIFYFFAKKFVAPIIKLIWIKKIFGLENLPKSGPCVITANHQSYFDFLGLFSVLPRKITFLAAEKFFTSRFWRPIIEYTGQIRVNRDSEDKKEVFDLGVKVLRDGRVLGIFPQGTRSRSGEIEKTFTGVARFALAARVPVIPVGIKGAYEIMPPQAKKPKLKKNLEIIIGKPMDFGKYYEVEKTPELYRRITNEIILEIARLADKKYVEENL
ncbi:MAG: lysophospholipid acyltransferase family protein [Patescibacteria group bacterium]|nr:lysophospholipid acyltransferase family protein [Patescibacteria group bacterium]MDD4610880.1 lysophospholipid acyltransferase family protein [Patescibacteria group bacterium]